MLKQIWLKSALALGAVALGALALAPAPASAEVFVHVGVPFGCCGPYYYYPPPPVVYAPPPYYYAPPPVAYAPPPAPPTPLAPQAQTWYYCDNPKGYYPYVSNCESGWRQVPTRP